MQVIRGLHNLRPEHRPCIATIGNFDGVHLGHQAVFRRLQAKEQEFGLPATVITFEPQPQEYFAPNATPARLTRLREKLQAFYDAGIQRVLLLEFGAKLATTPAQDFIQQLLLDKLAIRYLLVGDDFRFGHQRQGNFALLQAAGKQHHFGVESTPTYVLDTDRVSSTRIRQALAAGDLELAYRCLGRPYQICGRVVYGNQRGRTIGFPTVNINLHRRVSPLRGVFAVRVSGKAIGATPWPGVANIGNRPTLNSHDPRYILETHLLDFDRQIYGSHLSVTFVRKLRDEQRFASFEALRQQIHLDTQAARHCLERSDPYC